MRAAEICRPADNQKGEEKGRAMDLQTEESKPDIQKCRQTILSAPE
jgi:hypothetical protein